MKVIEAVQAVVFCDGPNARDGRADNATRIFAKSYAFEQQRAL